MNGNDNDSAENHDESSHAKTIKFHFHKAVQVTKVFAREDHPLTKNDTIFTMVDADNPGRAQTVHGRGTHERDCLSLACRQQTRTFLVHVLGYGDETVR